MQWISIDLQKKALVNKLISMEFKGKAVKSNENHRQRHDNQRTSNEKKRKS